MILKVIAELEFKEPTLIQQESIPLILKGKDLIGEAKTGSGKTAAFGFPIIQKLKPNTRKSQFLVITPTRELCVQVSKDLQTYAQFIKLRIATIYGGVPYKTQIKSLPTAEIVVATLVRQVFKAS